MEKNSEHVEGGWRNMQKMKAKFEGKKQQKINKSLQKTKKTEEKGKNANKRKNMNSKKQN